MLRRADAWKATGKPNVEELEQRTTDKAAIATVLDAPDAPIPQKLTLEGYTSADCVIRCENLLICIEGKRTDKLSAGTAHDSKRDQVARNLEAAWRLAKGTEFRVIICSEGPLDANEMAPVDGPATAH